MRAKKAIDLLGLDADILGLERFDCVEQAKKDVIYERMRARCEFDPETQCLIYTGAWERNGQAKIRVGGRVYCLSRVTAWLYVEGFALWSLERAVRTCSSPACCNHTHIRVLPDQAAALEAQLRRGRLGRASHRLTRAGVDRLRELARQGVPAEELTKLFGIKLPAVRAVILGRTWPQKEKACPKK